MAVASEIQSLNDITYKSKFKIILVIGLILSLFTFSFINHFPLGDKIKSSIKMALKGRGCNPDFDEIRLEFLMPKIIISNLVIPANCLERDGEPLKFTHITINYRLINFKPFGIPFKIDTEFGGQPLSFYYVQGINQQLIRMIDQTINLARLQPLLGDQIKMAGKLKTDLTLEMSKGSITALDLKVASFDFQFPPQNIQGFTTPPLRINTFSLEAKSESAPRVDVTKLILGSTDSPMRAKFSGKIILQDGQIGMSPVDLKGEIAFSESFTQALPLINMMFQQFDQKDGFYQIRLGGTLNALRPAAL